MTTVTVSLRDVAGDLTDENRKDSVQVDPTGTGGSTAALNGGLILEAVCDAVGLGAAKASDYALWILFDDNGLLCSSLSTFFPL